jgi:hypothetical protein
LDQQTSFGEMPDVPQYLDSESACISISGEEDLLLAIVTLERRLRAARFVPAGTVWASRIVVASHDLSAEQGRQRVLPQEGHAVGCPDIPGLEVVIRIRMAASTADWQLIFTADFGGIVQDPVGAVSPRFI